MNWLLLAYLSVQEEGVIALISSVVTLLALGVSYLLRKKNMDEFYLTRVIFTSIGVVALMISLAMIPVFLMGLAGIK
jgi:energy-converting hydrogenase Eha subunit A